MAKKKNLTWIWNLIFLIIILALLVSAFFILKSKGVFQSIINQNNTNDNSGSSGNIQYSCIDSDEGLSYYMVGHTTDQDNIKYYDKCESNSFLTEYYCSNNKVTTRGFICPTNYKCFQTRSGGYCNPLPTYQNGDLISSDSQSGVIISSSNEFIIDLGDIETGNCGLMAQISTGWDYANDKCQGIQAGEGIEWNFYDSDSLEYSRIDQAPIGLGIQTECVLDYDGTPFRLTMDKIIELTECEIDYNWEVRIVACNCQ